MWGSPSETLERLAILTVEFFTSFNCLIQSKKRETAPTKSRSLYTESAANKNNKDRKLGKGDGTGEKGGVPGRGCEHSRLRGTGKAKGEFLEMGVQSRKEAGRTMIGRQGGCI